MFCPNCGTNLADNTPMCTTCGYQMHRNKYPEPQPVYQQPAYQEPVYQAPASPIPLSKKAYLEMMAPESVKKAAGFVTVTCPLLAVLLLAGTVATFVMPVVDIPVVAFATLWIDDETLNYNEVTSKLDKYYDRVFKFSYRNRKDLIDKERRVAMEKANDALVNAADTLSIFNFRRLLANSDQYGQDMWTIFGYPKIEILEHWNEEKLIYEYTVVEENDDELRQTETILDLIMGLILVSSFFLPLLLTILAGVNKSTGLSVAALIFTAISQLMLSGIIWVLLCAAAFIAQAVICSKVNKAYQDYRTGRTAA